MDNINEDIETKLAKAFLQFNKLHRFSKYETESSERNACNENNINLKYSEFHLLFFIRYYCQQNAEGVTASEISAHMRVKPPTINPLLTNLEKHSLIARTPDKKDRRYVRIEMTPDGERFIAEHEKKWLDKIRGLAAFLGKEKSEELVTLMNDVYHYFDESITNASNRP